MCMCALSLSQEGGLYDKLFQSLCYTQDRVYRKLLSQQAKRYGANCTCTCTYKINVSTYPD